VRDRKSKVNSQNSGATTLIAASTCVVGEIYFHGNLEIEGKVVGNIIAEEGADSRVRVLPSGEVEGEIHAPLVIVNGAVAGNLYVREQLELASKAVVEGDVHYQLIQVENGAQVNGQFIRDAGVSETEDDQVVSEKLKVVSTS
jgi:cytoskeletal protein CcmA (bactofilin family)